ncbi:pro-pol protein [Moniliophthora roreri MCA 2997]|uniref:Pro-pol protein n=1 Tax=Moniliophthora roreri (strain MCA 2997) TaxID=1381753 RepID=V2WHU0_MONRO|nr:pro-pol protein [Moniliophthora roreri MCA 2997]
MLCRDGIKDVNPPVLNICNGCYKDLCNHCKPKFSLANDLYQGSLPKEFSDLTWIEEMVCVKYWSTAHVTHLYHSDDEQNPRVMTGNTCAYEMNVVSTANILPRLPSDLNDMLSLVIVGPCKLTKEELERTNLYCVRHSKIGKFLMWLKNHNYIYAKTFFSASNLLMYPKDGLLPGIEEQIVYNHDLDPETACMAETAGFSEHPSDIIMNDKMMIEPYIKYSGAIRNLFTGKNPSNSPDLILHHSGRPASEYNNSDLFPERLAKLGIRIPGNPASTSRTIITRHHRQSALRHVSSLLGHEGTTDIEEPKVEETPNSSIPESTDSESPMSENSDSRGEKNETLPEESTSSSSSNDSEDEAMSKGGSSTLKPKPREDRTQTQMMIEISTAVLEEMEKKKNKGSKVAAPDPFEGDRKEMKRFLMEVEIYLRMHPTEYNNNEKKCLFLLSYLQGKNTEAWKKTQSKKIFELKSGEEALTFSQLKDEFKKHYLLADIQAEAQIKIKEAKMTDRADNYVNDFRVMADESGYDDQALIHIFRRGLPNSLSAKILNQPQGRPADLEGWYKAAIRYDEQYKYYEAVQKPKRFRIGDDKKKKVTINRINKQQLSNEERKKYIANGRCFRCTKQGHVARDCPTKQGGGERKEEKKKLSAREAYVKIQAIVREQEMEQQTELLDIMEAEAKQSRNSMHIPLFYNNKIGKVRTNALLDSGAGGLFMSPEKARQLGLEQTRLPHRIKVFNMDGTANKMAWIMQSLSTSQRLEHNAEKGKEEAVPSIPEYLSQYQGQFEDKEAEQFPISQSYDHTIDLKPEFTPHDCKIYSLTALEQTKLDTFLAENLRKGYIRKSKSPMASPFFFVGKKEKGKLRPTQDYRRLNHRTIKNAYPLPLVSDLIDKLKDTTIFSKLDLCNGYNNVRIKDRDQWKAVLMNSPVTFQAFMDNVLQDFMAEGWCLVYMDNILIYSATEEEHRRRTIRLLRRLKEQDLYLKPHKCKFDVQEIDFLGLVIQPGQISMDPTKLSGISDWPAPTTVTGVRSFTGFTNFYRKFIGNYSAITKPLYDLTKKGVPFRWTELCETAFQTLKRKFQQEPVLRMPDPNRPFMIEMDTLKWASGGVLWQEGPDGELHPCGYISHAFDSTERNYEIYDRELFAIIRALETWRHHLMEGPYPKLNRRQARWSLILSLFDLRLVHVPGRDMVQSDALSRRTDHVQGIDNDNEDVILLPEQLFVNVIDVELQDKLRDRLGTDDFHKMTLESLTTHGVPPIKSALTNWEVNDSLIRFKGRVYILDDVVLRREITKTIHEGQPFGHPGQFGTLDLVQRDYWWPGMAKFVKSFMDGCAICQQMKINTHPTKVGLQPLPSTPNATPFQIITMDLMTDLPESDGFDTIMVVVDHSSSKGAIFIPCTKKLDAPQAAELLL